MQQNENNNTVVSTSTELPYGYKMTKLGMIPNDWKVINLGDIVDSKTKWSFTGGPFGSNLKAEHYTDKGIKIIQLQNIGDGNFLERKFIYTSKEKADDLLSCNIYPNDIIISKMGDPVARACIIPDNGKDERYLMSSDGIRLVPDKNKFDSFFVKEYINHSIFRKIAIRNSIGSTRSRIGLVDLRNLPFPLLKLSEQQQIANILSTWDKGINTTKNLIQQLQQRKKGLLQQLLSGQKRLPGFSEEWEVKRLGSIIDFYNGKGHENSVSEDGKYILINSKFVSTEGRVHKKVEKAYFLLQENDICIVMSDIPNGKAIAKCYYVESKNKYTLNQRIGCLRSKNVDSKYLFYSINRNSYYLRFDDGVKQTNLRKDEVLSCPIPFPQLAEQQAIAKVLTAVEEEITNYQTYLQTLQAQKKGLMQQLLTGAKRVAV